MLCASHALIFLFWCGLGGMRAQPKDAPQSRFPCICLKMPNGGGVAVQALWGAHGGTGSGPSRHSMSVSVLTWLRGKAFGVSLFVQKR